ncbi:MAG: tetratricopeptide repeat protein [Acidobacteriota bacterium]
MPRNRSSRKTPRRPPPPESAPSWGLWWRAALIALAGVLAYSNSLSGAFILDDQSTIVDNPQIRALWDLGKVLTPEPDTAIAGRPLVNLSFAINYAVGGLAVRGYHVGNIALHIVCALLVFGIVRRTIELPRVARRGGISSANVAFAVALLWVVHPLNSEVVDYLTERTESMMGMFTLLTLYFSLRQWPLPAVLSCGLGMACKESMVVAPLLVAVYDRVYLFDSVKQAFRARKLLYLGLAATWIVLALLNWSGPRAAVGGFSAGSSAWTYLLNQAVMITHYLRLAFWPRELVVFYGWVLPLTLGDVWPYALFIVVLLVATVVAMKRWPTLGFLGAWFFLTLAPTSSIVPIATEVGAERRMYLPLLAVITLTVVAAAAAWAVVARRRRVGQHSLNTTPASASSAAPGPSLPAGAGFSRIWSARGGEAAALLLLAALAGALAAGTVKRNREYASPLTIAQTVVDRRPSGVAHHMLAERLSLDGRHDEAVTHLREAVRGGNSRAGYLLGVELFNAGKLPEAIDQFEAFVRTSGRVLVPRWLEPSGREVIVARAAMGRAFAMQSRWPQAAAQAQAVLAVAPNNAEARFLLANALFQQQRYEEAGGHYREYLKAQPDDVNALTNSGVTLIAAGRLDEAIGLFRRAAEVDPRSPRTRQVLALALFDRGDFAGAAEQARAGLGLSGNDSAMRDLLGRTLASALRESGRRPKP